MTTESWLLLSLAATLLTALAVLGMAVAALRALRKPPWWDRTMERERAWQTFDRDWRDRHVS